MYVLEKSDCAVIPVNQPNKGGQPSAEAGEGRAHIQAALLIGVWLVSQLFHAGAVAHTQTGGVAYLAHVGGLIFGAVTARFFEDPRRLALQPPGD